MLHVSPPVFTAISIFLFSTFFSLNVPAFSATIDAATALFRDITPPQLIGEYQNIPLPTIESSNPPISFPQCPDFIKVDRVEILQTDVATLFILPHRFISLLIQGGGTTPCVGTLIDSPLTPESSTILRRNDQVIPLDTNDTLVSEFHNSDETFFLGLELGPRICGLTQLDTNSKSMWVAPKKVISVQVPPSGFIVKFTPGFKYVIYFHPIRPCVLYGNASDLGLVTAAPTQSPSSTSTETATPSTTPTNSFTPSPLPSSSSVPPSLQSTNQPLPISQVPTFQNNQQQRACFPSSALVQVVFENSKSRSAKKHKSRQIREIRMDQLQIGMIIYVGSKTLDYSCQVVGFTHQDAHIRSWMIQFSFEQTNDTIKASPGHFLYVMRTFCIGQRNKCEEKLISVRADHLRLGDLMIESMNRKYLQVASINYVFEKGLFNPQTSCGDISINGIIATTYTAVTGSVKTGHALMAPWRAFFQVFYFFSASTNLT